MIIWIWLWYNLGYVSVFQLRNKIPILHCIEGGVNIDIGNILEIVQIGLSGSAFKWKMSQAVGDSSSFWTTYKMYPAILFDALLKNTNHTFLFFLHSPNSPCKPYLPKSHAVQQQWLWKRDQMLPNMFKLGHGYNFCTKPPLGPSTNTNMEIVSRWPRYFTFFVTL